MIFEFTWILPSLCFCVLIKILVMCIRIITFVALICCLSKMCLQNHEDHHSFATLLALIWFLQSAYHHVMPFLYRLHWYGLSPECFWMSRKTSILYKTLSHCLHWYSLSHCCVNIWSLRIHYCECGLSHSLYFYDHSLKCALKCILKSLFFEKTF